MAEYIEREALIKSFNCNGGMFTYGDTLLKAIISRINLAATADVVEVVRCKDCKNYSNFDTKKCKRLEFHFCKKFSNITKEFDFCSYGKRKEGAE